VNAGKVPEAHVTVVGAATNPLMHAPVHTVVSTIVAPVSPVQAAVAAFVTPAGMVHEPGAASQHSSIVQVVDAHTLGEAAIGRAVVQTCTSAPAAGQVPTAGHVNAGKVPEAHVTVVGAATNPLTHATVHTVVSAIVAPVSPVQAAVAAFVTPAVMVHGAASQHSSIVQVVDAHVVGEEAEGRAAVQRPLAGQMPGV